MHTSESGVVDKRENETENVEENWSDRVTEEDNGHWLKRRGHCWKGSKEFSSAEYFGYLKSDKKWSIVHFRLWQKHVPKYFYHLKQKGQKYWFGWSNPKKLFSDLLDPPAPSRPLDWDCPPCCLWAASHCWSSFSLLCPRPSRPLCCIWHSEPPDPYFLPPGPGCLWLCSLPALILPQRPHLPGNLERICVWTLSSHHWGPSRFRPGSPLLLSRLCHSLTWLFLPQLCWWHPTHPLFSPNWNTGSSTSLCLSDWHLSVDVLTPPEN